VAVGEHGGALLKTRLCALFVQELPGCSCSLQSCEQDTGCERLTPRRPVVAPLPQEGQTTNQHGGAPQILLLLRLESGASFPKEHFGKETLLWASGRRL